MRLPNRWSNVFVNNRLPNILFSEPLGNKRMKIKAMNLARTPWRICCAAALVTVAVGCALPQRTEELLSQAGFKSVQANTSSRQTRLRALPADRITMIQRQGTEYFVFT